MDCFTTIIDTYDVMITRCRNEAKDSNINPSEFGKGWDMGYSAGLENAIGDIEFLRKEYYRVKDKMYKLEQENKAMRAELDKINHPSNWNTPQEQATKANRLDADDPW